MPDQDDKQRSSKRPLEPSETARAREVSSESLAKGDEANAKGSVTDGVPAGTKKQKAKEKKFEMPTLATEPNDTFRVWAGIFVGLVGIGGFACLTRWAATSVSLAFRPETIESTNLPAILVAKALVFLSAGGFCYALLALAERLTTPYALLMQMVELKARAKQEKSEGFSSKALDQVASAVERVLKALPGRE